MTPDPASVSGTKASATTLVRERGGRGFSSGGGNRGFSRGFSSGGNRGFSSRSMSPRIGGGNRAMRFNGGGSRKFDGGGSRRFGRGHGVPREGIHINPRYARNHGHHHHHHHKHRRHRFPGIAIYGAAPYFYDWDSGDACEDLYENATATGSAYWWNLYYDCRDGD